MSLRWMLRPSSSIDEREDSPDYLQNMLLMYGYDKMSTLAEFDVCADIDKMLEYINDTCTDHSM